ncbi:unnamed protein product [Ambrosiozyma monospora]|uniref:Unnamed protein product n=1 Tax=Ambrosiozyma monospora TaxID=43982 RepID=A0ACB5SYB6_AMBMO|nr:unnamed protein product [Ambrosiozyma monospora]
MLDICKSSKSIGGLTLPSTFKAKELKLDISNIKAVNENRKLAVLQYPNILVVSAMLSVTIIVDTTPDDTATGNDVDVTIKFHTLTLNMGLNPRLEHGRKWKLYFMLAVRTGFPLAILFDTLDKHFLGDSSLVQTCPVDNPNQTYEFAIPLGDRREFPYSWLKFSSPIFFRVKTQIVSLIRHIILIVNLTLYI